MRKVMTITALAAVASLALVGNASAANVQQSIIKILPTSGTGKPKKSSNVLIESYLSTRDSSSTRGGTKTGSPVGKVFMDFPKGSTVLKTAVPTCNISEYFTPAQQKAACASSVVGTGWALMRPSTLAVSQSQLEGAPATCAVDDATQYDRTYEANPAAGPSCVPFGTLWVKTTMYQGAILKGQWWCYGDAGAPKPGAACNNKATGGDAKNTLLATGPLNGSFNDLSNKKALNGCNVIFANDNGVAPLSFGGTVTSCKNRLTVLIPATNGEGSGLGELPGGFILSDFYLKITNAKFLKTGSAACSAGNMTVSTQVVYSKVKGESANPMPASNTNTTKTPC